MVVMVESVSSPVPQRRVILSGSSGFIGGRLTSLLVSRGYHVDRLVRCKPNPDQGEIGWNPDTGEIDSKSMEAAEAVIHLAGESIAGRWTAARKAAILDSRVKGTRLLSETISRLERKPRVFIPASAIGLYGNRGGESVHEESAPGTGFLADVCYQWEAATQPASEAGIRVVNYRIGIVLAAEGGALAKMLTPFKLGLGGRIGSGRQFMSWISREDLVNAMEFLIRADSVAGPLNAVAPNPVTNAEFTKTLGAVLHRPTIFPMPEFMVRLIFGEMGQALLLEGAKVACAKLQASGYSFLHATLENALRSELSSSRSS